MGIRELRERYGRNKKGREAVNAAIRAELPGGNEALDALARLHARYVAARGNGDLAAAELMIAVDSVRQVTEAMAEEVARRYGLKNSRTK